jgi:protein-tyrosine kinase
MERIKQAIQKARQESSRRVSADEPSHLPNGGQDELGAVSYTQTRVVELDEDHLEKNRIVSFSKRNYLSMHFDILRTQVLRKMDENGWRTLAIVSPTPECGKTVVAINLAMSIAHHTYKTAMLVDFDLRRPRVASYLGIQAEVSLNEVLAGDADIAEAMVNPGLPKLVLLPTTRPVSKSSELLSSKKVAALIKELRERYPDRIVIFDLPPILRTDDAISLLPKIDCTLMVIGNGMVSESELEETMRHLQASNFLGTVLNKADIPAKDLTYY